VEGLVLGLRGANAREVVEGVRAKLAEIAKTLPQGVTLKPFYDRGSLVDRAIGTVSEALVAAIVLVLILLVLFLGNVRAALVVALVLPLSALTTFVLMRGFGLSANLMSLGGLAIAIGMLVDAAVVVVENIEAYAARSGPGGAAQRLHTIFRAAQEVAVPVTAGIAIIVIVFLPLLTLQGLEGKLFIPVALTIVFALSGSLLLSLTVIPVLASFMLGSAAHKTPWLVRKLDRLYAPSLDWTLAHPRTVYAVAIALLIVAGALFPLLGKSFMPTLDEGDIIMQLEKLPSINLNRSAGIDLAVQRRVLQAVPEVRNIVARSGSDELGLDPMGLNETDSFLVLKPPQQWRTPDKEAIVDDLRRIAAEFPGVNFSFTQPIEMRTSEMLSGVRGDVAIKIFGPDMKQLSALAERIVGLVAAVPGSQDVLTVKNEGVQYFQVDIDRAAAGRLALSVEEIQNDLRALVEGRVAGTIIEQARRLPLIVRGSENLKLSPALFEQVRLPVAGGQAVPLSHVARLATVDGPVKIERENSSRMVVVRANVRGRDLVGFVADAQAAVAGGLPLPPGYRLAWGGQFENQQRAAARLAIVVPIALGLIFLLLFATVGSLRQAALIFINIPFALTGGIIALAVTGEYLSVPASVGFIALMGIAVLNGLVMVTYFNQLRARGMAAIEVVTEGAKRRLRPVMMTASITAFGLVPLLVATGPGSEIQRPLAIVVIGGLITSTLLTLVLLPNLFRRYGMGERA
jgi:cobalt-zinc-cadmium resistance protein CzcA